MVDTTFENLCLLFEIWQSRRTGTLIIAPEFGTTDASVAVPIDRGGIPEGLSWNLLLDRLSDGALQLRESSRSAVGSRRAMGALLQLASRRHQVDLLHLLAPLAPTEPEPVELDEQETLLRAGRVALAARRYAEADRLLSAARDIRFDHPDALALLAIARHHNPERDEAERVADARRFLGVARQLDATAQDVIYAGLQISCASDRLNNTTAVTTSAAS